MALGLYTCPPFCRNVSGLHVGDESSAASATVGPARPKGCRPEAGLRINAPGPRLGQRSGPRSPQVPAGELVAGRSPVSLPALRVCSDFDPLKGRTTLRVAHGVMSPWAMPPAAPTARGRFVVTHPRRALVGRGEGGIAFQPSFDLRHGNDPQAATANDPKLRLDMALERRLAYADGLCRLLDGQPEAREARGGGCRGLQEALSYPSTVAGERLLHRFSPRKSPRPGDSSRSRCRVGS